MHQHFHIIMWLVLLASSFFWERSPFLKKNTKSSIRTRTIRMITGESCIFVAYVKKSGSWRTAVDTMKTVPEQLASRSQLCVSWARDQRRSQGCLQSFCFRLRAARRDTKVRSASREWFYSLVATCPTAFSGSWVSTLRPPRILRPRRLSSHVGLQQQQQRNH